MYVIDSEIKQTYDSVRALRGIWALLIVTFHTIIMLRDRLHIEVGMFNGAGGVDLFFAISGFSIIMATRALAGKPNTAWPFLKRRLIRIVPLYWLATTIKLCILVAGGHAIFTSWHSISSYFFIPAWNHNHELFPVMIPGWTLSFEMLFYFVTATLLMLRKEPLVPITILFVGAAIIGLAFRPFDVAPLRMFDPLLLEFVAGMWICRRILSGQTLSKPIAVFLMVACIFMILSTNSMPVFVTDQYRFIIWGIPSAVLLYAALSLEDWSLWKLRALKILGGASFAIYVTHDFAISSARVVVSYLQLDKSMSIVFAISLALIFSIIMGIFVNRFVEKPMTLWLNNKWDKKTDRAATYIYTFQRKPTWASIAPQGI